MTDLSGYCHQCNLRIAQPCLSTILEFMRFTTAAVVQAELWAAEADEIIPKGCREDWIHGRAWDEVQTKFFESCTLESCCAGGNFDLEHMIKVAAYVTAFELESLASAAVYEEIPGLESL